MRINTLFAIFFTLISLSGCASTDTPFEGVPNALILANGNSIKEKLGLGCVNGGGRVVQEGSSYIVCAKPFDDSMNSLMYRALLTEGSTASNPEINVQTTWAKQGKAYHVVSRAWIEHQNVFGKTSRNYLDSPQVKRALQSGLEKLKDSLNKK